MAFLVEQPIDGLVPESAWVLFDLGLCAETVCDEAAQVIRVTGRVGDHMPDARKVFDQTTRLIRTTVGKSATVVAG